MLRSNPVAEGGHTPFALLALLALFAFAETRVTLVSGFPRQLLLDESKRRPSLRRCRQTKTECAAASGRRFDAQLAIEQLGQPSRDR
jgi:hypothetical protein